jgi:hypothetical protein
LNCIEGDNRLLNCNDPILENKLRNKIKNKFPNILESQKVIQLFPLKIFKYRMKCRGKDCVFKVKKAKNKMKVKWTCSITISRLSNFNNCSNQRTTLQPSVKLIQFSSILRAL